MVLSYGAYNLKSGVICKEVLILLFIFMMSFFISLLVSMAIIFSANMGGSGIMDYDLNAIQKMHDIPVPRIGGVAIFISLVFISVYGSSIGAEWSQFFARVIISAFFVFLGGFIEDVSKKVTPFIRIMFIIFAVIFGVFFSHSMDLVRNLDHDLINTVLEYDLIAFSITCFAVVGISNAYNMIDGYNGLSATAAIINITSIAILSYYLNDSYLLFSSIVIIGAILGFLLLNYPRGKIFLGDGGSYLIGFLISMMSISLVEDHRGAISPFAVLLLVIYPFTEAVFTIFRRKFVHKTKATEPDDLHLHQLVFNKFTNKNKSLVRRNATVMPLMLIMIIPQMLMVLAFYQSTMIMLSGVLAYFILYTCVYTLLIKS